MRYRLLSAIYATALSLGLLGATAPQAGAQQIQFNCAMLSGSPYMCLKNESAMPVVAVQAFHSGVFNPSSWIMIPGGGIPPNGAAVVKFPVFSGGPIQTIVVKTADGQPHLFPNTDVVHSTSLTIRW